jgi:hypothetical protein
MVTQNPYHFEISAEGICKAEELFGVGSPVALMVREYVNLAAAQEFGHLLGEWLEQLFSAPPVN